MDLPYQYPTVESQYFGPNNPNQDNTYNTWYSSNLNSKPGEMTSYSNYKEDLNWLTQENMFDINVPEIKEPDIIPLPTTKTITSKTITSTKKSGLNPFVKFGIVVAAIVLIGMVVKKK